MRHAVETSTAMTREIFRLRTCRPLDHKSQPMGFTTPKNNTVGVSRRKITHRVRPFRTKDDKNNILGKSRRKNRDRQSY